MSGTPIKVNGRFLAHRPTGMQRYALEVTKRCPFATQLIRPSRGLRGAAGHLWEQLYLPVATGNDLLWSPNNTGPLAAARQICTIHDLIPLDHPEWFAVKFVAFYRWLLPRLTRRLRHIIAISEFTKSRLMDLFRIDERKITVIPNGVDAAFRPQPQESIDALRKALGLDGRPYVLCVGSVEPRKNLKALLTAWTMLSKSARDEHQLVIAGPKGNSVVFRDAGIGDVPTGVQFTGYIAQEQLPVLYAGAAVFVYPSLYEGFGLPPLEAMASGVPVLSSRTSSIPEVVGDSAVLVDPRQPEEIASQLEKLLADKELRAALASRGLSRAAQMSWDATASRTWGLLAQQARH